MFVSNLNLPDGGICSESLFTGSGNVRDESLNVRLMECCHL